MRAGLRGLALDDYGALAKIQREFGLIDDAVETLGLIEELADDPDPAPSSEKTDSNG